MIAKLTQATAPANAFPPDSILANYPPSKFHLGQKVEFDWLKTFPECKIDYLDRGEVIEIVWNHSDFEYYHRQGARLWIYLVHWEAGLNSSFKYPCNDFAHEFTLKPLLA